MTGSAHLTVWNLTLITRSPLYVGSGNVCAKTDYIFDPRSETLRMLDPEALFRWLYERRLADRYESFILSGDTRMFRFLKDCGITDRELDSLCMYRVSAADALDDSHSLKELHTFLRDSENRAYVPGSGVKGALRTVLLVSLIAREKKGVWPDDPKKAGRARQMQTLEGRYLNTLPLKRDRDGKPVNDPVNSILRGISISDSEPVSDADMILVGKIDANKKGECRKLPLCRECIRPGTELCFKLSMDSSVLPEAYSVGTLVQMIKGFDRYYQETYLSRFAPPPDACAVSYADALILGGGAGFFSKNLAYPYLGTEKALHYTQKIMEEQFRRHGHEKDCTVHGISPHTMKYGKYRGQLYPYGVCGVQIT